MPRIAIFGRVIGFMQTTALFHQIQKIQKDVDLLEPLVKALIAAKTKEQKSQALSQYPTVREKEQQFAEPLKKCKSADTLYIFRSLFAIQQGDHLFSSPELMSALEILSKVEELYSPIGGIVGYHLEFLKHLIEKESVCQVQHGELERPPGFNLEDNDETIRTALRSGIDNLSSLAEIYPVAGAADRLDLHHEVSGEPLPAAQLHFLGYTLLEGLIRDLQAREYLYFKLKGKRITVPIVLMTSEEKMNHDHVTTICEQHGWFGRKTDSFYFIKQPLAPVISEKGEWVIKPSGQFAMKPGGHGVIWKLAEDQGAFSWLKSLHKTHLILRQINNPLAGLDNLLLALSGIGCMQNRSFGFTSCDRIVHSAEGMNVLMHHPSNEGFHYKITNIEYTDFEMLGIKDVPASPGSPYSLYPANTNILFAKLRAIRKALPSNPFPGMLINLKECIHKPNPQGVMEKIAIGRLESIMQNIADSIVTKSPVPLTSEEKLNLPTFILFNKRQKTLAATKKSYKPGGPILETPEGAYDELLKNRKELLESCGFSVPPLVSEKDYLDHGPSFIFHYHPALGPLYTVIAQKLRGGVLKQGAELNLEIAEADIADLSLDGSLNIKALSPLGHHNAKGYILNSHQGGKCTLHHVKIFNEGIDRDIEQTYWKCNLSRKESMQITIEGSGEFIAENVEFHGPYELFVPHGYQMRASQEGKSVKFTLKKLAKPSWFWNYSYDDLGRIHIEVGTL